MGAHAGLTGSPAKPDPRLAMSGSSPERRTSGVVPVVHATWDARHVAVHRSPHARRCALHRGAPAEARRPRPFAALRGRCRGRRDHRGLRRRHSVRPRRGARRGRRRRPGARTRARLRVWRRRKAQDRGRFQRRRRRASTRALPQAAAFTRAARRSHRCRSGGRHVRGPQPADASRLRAVRHADDVRGGRGPRPPRSRECATTSRRLDSDRLAASRRRRPSRSRASTRRWPAISRPLRFPRTTRSLRPPNSRPCRRGSRRTNRRPRFHARTSPACSRAGARRDSGSARRWPPAAACR